MKTTFRPINDSDIPLLFTLYASTRADEMAMVNHWSDEEKQKFLEQQFYAQHTFYQKTFTEASFDVIMLEDQPIGRLYVDRKENEIRLIDITLLPNLRQKGIGSQLLNDLMKEAAASKKTLSIHVEQFNPAMRLYKRLGFTKIEDQGVYHLMEWNPFKFKKLATTL